MNREEILHEYESAVAAHAAAAAAGIKGAKKSYELFKAGLSALTQPTQEQVEKVWRGKWVDAHKGLSAAKCKKCNSVCSYETRFCPYCGAAMTDEAVEMVMERLEELNNA